MSKKTGSHLNFPRSTSVGNLIHRITHSQVLHLLTVNNKITSVIRLLLGVHRLVHGNECNFIHRLIENKLGNTSFLFRTEKKLRPKDSLKNIACQ